MAEWIHTRNSAGVMRIICALLGHRWDIPTGNRCWMPISCKRCGGELISHA